MKSRREQISYVAKQMVQGFQTYSGVDVASLATLDDEGVAIEYDCALNWAGEEYFSLNLQSIKHSVSSPFLLRTQ